MQVLPVFQCKAGYNACVGILAGCIYEIKLPDIALKSGNLSDILCQRVLFMDLWLWNDIYWISSAKMMLQICNMTYGDSGISSF